MDSDNYGCAAPSSLPSSETLVDNAQHPALYVLLTCRMALPKNGGRTRWVPHVFRSQRFSPHTEVHRNGARHGHHQPVLTRMRRLHFSDLRGSGTSVRADCQSTCMHGRHLKRMPWCAGARAWRHRTSSQHPTTRLARRSG